MPSNSRNTVRYPIDLYPTDIEDLQKVINKFNLKRTSFLRECVRYVLQNPEATALVAEEARTPVYTRRN